MTFLQKRNEVGISLGNYIFKPELQIRPYLLQGKKREKEKYTKGSYGVQCMLDVHPKDPQQNTNTINL